MRQPQPAVERDLAEKQRLRRPSSGCEDLELATLEAVEWYRNRGLSHVRASRDRVCRCHFGLKHREAAGDMKND